MRDQVTSFEQSNRLIEMGVPADKASMVWEMDEDCARLKIWNTDKETRRVLHNKYPNYYVPAFTVVDLLAVLPPKISWQDPSDGNFRMRRYMGENGIEWVVDYDRFIANDVSIINALVETIILLVSTKHELNL